MKSILRVPLGIVSLLLAGCIQPPDVQTVTGGCKTGDLCAGEPLMVAGDHRFTNLAAGKYHTCGLTSSGEVWCWGSNERGQLGVSTSGSTSSIPVRVGSQTTFASITAGELHTCALASGGAAYCWGSNVNSAIGVATVNDTCAGAPCAISPVRAAGTLTFVALDAGATHNCAVDTSGVTRCWGSNFFGESGSDAFGTATASPVAVSGGHTFSTVSGGYRSNCALDVVGSLYCWGLGEDGQLGTLGIGACGSGITSFRCSAAPVAANTPASFSAVSSGAAFACGITKNGVLMCWGLNAQGQLGTSGFVSSPNPTLVDIDGTWSSLDVGYFHACALRSSGAALCWGLNNTGQLGDGSALYTSTFPTPVAGGKTFMRIVTGANHTCALTSDGVAWCWGADLFSQLGRG